MKCDLPNSRLAFFVTASFSIKWNYNKKSKENIKIQCYIKIIKTSINDIVYYISDIVSVIYLWH